MRRVHGASVELDCASHVTMPSPASPACASSNSPHPSVTSLTPPAAASPAQLRQTGIIVEALGQDKAGAEPLKALCDQYLESVAELQTSFEQQITKFEDQSTSVSVQAVSYQHHNGSGGDGIGVAPRCRWP